MASAMADSKSLKKKKVQAEALTANNDASSHASGDPPHLPATNGAESTDENPHIRELLRQIRNVHKKISACAKAEKIVADNPSESLDQLVSSKKLNNDQKAQILNRPSLQTRVTQLEEQLSQYRSFAQELEERFNHEKATLIQDHEAEIARLKDEAETKAQEQAETKEQDHGAKSKDFEGSLKVVSDFLHAAASKRTQLDESMDERRAFEGALLLVYQGNEASLSALHNLIDGSDDKVLDTDGTPVDFTYAQLKEASVAEALVSAQAVTEPVEAPTADTIPGDPTIANAGMTELEDTTTIPMHTNGISSGELETHNAPEQVSTTDDAANAIAQASWNPEASITTDASGTGEEWVQVPRDPAETDTGLTATPAAPANGNSWAEEVATSVEEQKKENDGFEQVRGRHADGRARGRGGRVGRGEYRGRGRGGPGRGGEGRGRGGPGRGRGGPREPRGDRS